MMTVATVTVTIDTAVSYSMAFMVKDLSASRDINAEKNEKKQVNSFWPTVGNMFSRIMVRPEQTSWVMVKYISSILSLADAI